MSVVKLLVSNDDINPDSTDNFGRTPLSLAAANGFKVVVELLLTRCNLDPYSKDAFGFTLLSLTAERGEHGIVEMLRRSCKEQGLAVHDDDVSAISVEDNHGIFCKVCLLSIKACKGMFLPCKSCLERRTFCMT